MLSCVRLFVPPGTVACQAPLSMRFSRQEYWSELPFPSPRNLPDPGIESVYLLLPLHWQVDSLPLCLQSSFSITCRSLSSNSKFLGGKIGEVQLGVKHDKMIQNLCCCSVTQSCLTLCDPKDCSTPGFPVHHQLLKLAQTHVF